MTTFEIDYDGNIHYEDYQQNMYDTCWQELINDNDNNSRISRVKCNCLNKRTKKQKSFICKCKQPPDVINKMKK